MKSGHIVLAETKVFEASFELFGSDEKVGHNHHHRALAQCLCEFIENRGQKRFALWLGFFQSVQNQFQMGRRAFRRDTLNDLLCDGRKPHRIALLCG